MSETQIGQQLFCMQVGQTFDRLNFKDKLVFDKKIDSKRSGKSHAVVFDINRHLPISFQSSTLQRTHQHRFVNTLKQTRTQITVNGNTLFNNNTSESAPIICARHLCAPVPL